MFDKVIEKIRNKNKKIKVISEGTAKQMTPTPELISTIEGLDNPEAIKAAQKGLNRLLKEMKNQKE